MTDWKTVHDSRPDRPPELDTTSSESTVYLRRNIQEERIELDDDMTMDGWTYEQMTYTKEEYDLLTGPATQATMQGITEQTATVVLATTTTGATNQAAVMQAINQQTAEIAAAVLAAKG